MPVSVPRSARTFAHLLIALAVMAGTLFVLPPTSAEATSPDIVISRVYGGGGNSGATLTHDYIELFNTSSTAINVTGWSVQYASSTGTSWNPTALSGTIQPGQYYLIQEAAGTGGTTPLPTPDVIGTIAMSGTNGKVALVNNTTPLTGTCDLASTVDFVGYGSSANCFEGSGATGTLTNTTDAARLNNGCTETDNNATDFATGTPAPRNSASPLNPCVGPTDPSGTGSANPDPVIVGNSSLLTVAVTPGSNPTSTGLAVSADLSTIGGSATQTMVDDGTNGDLTAGDLTFSWSATVTLATTPGAKSLPATITDAQVRTGNTTIALTVQAASTPAADVTISQVYGGGGNSGAVYTNDFIELYNRSAAAVNITGWSVQYASSAGTSWNTTTLSGTIQPGQYYLIQQAQGSGGTTPLPTPDAIGTVAMSGTNGKVALVNNSTDLSGSCPIGGGIIDFVGYGGSANCFEGTGPTGTLSNTTAAIRNGAGATDTNDNAADFTVGAPDPRNSGPAVDLAPTVDSTLPANGAVNVAIGANVTVTFSEAVDVTGSWFTIGCATSSTHTAAVTGGPTTFTLDPDVDFALGETCTVTVLAAQVTDSDVMDPPDNMDADFVFSFETEAVNACDLGFTPIYTIQGNGTASPLAGTTLSTKGVVVGDFQTGLSGFNIQDATGDADNTTSDGIFVFVPSANALSAVDVNVGDVVRVSGRVTEFNTLTEIDLVTAITICGAQAPPAATPVALPEVVNGDLERQEGMLVTFAQDLTVSQNFFQGRYGQVTLSSDGRLFTPTNQFTPLSPGAIALADENARRLLVLDDGTSLQNPNPIPYIGVDNTLRAGDTTAGLTGIIDYGLITSNSTTRDYRLQPTVTPTFTRVNNRTAAPAPVGGDVQVAAFNVLNYFNGDGLGGGYPTARGATNAAEFDRQRTKIIAAMVAIDADVVGLMELENDASPNSAIEDLVSGLNAATTPGKYSFINTGIVGTDEIKVGIIYQPAVVTPAGAYQVLDSSVNPLFNDQRNRPAIAQTFADAGGAKFTVAVNHFKSKGSSCDSDGDFDLGDGQGNCNQTRLDAANALTQWLATDPTGSGDTDFIILGDLNAYAQEDPITAIKGAGYTNLIETYLGDTAYSFTFDGQSGYLDHALATSSLAAQVVGVTEWHINTDEPSVIDYNTEFKPQDLYSPTPYRSSDHDPVIVGLNLNAPPTVNAGGPYSVNEGGTVGLNATGSDPDGDTLTYSWDLDNNGSFETAGQSVTFSAAALDGPGSAIVNVKATDPGGLSATAQTTITVVNVAPVVSAPVVSPEPSTIGQSVTGSATFTDPAPNDAPFTCTINYGDGSGVMAGTVGGTTCTGPAHTYSAIGTYTVTVAVTDKDGGVGTAMSSHSVNFAFVGFFAPIDNSPTVNMVKGGSAVPIKFSLTGDQGLAILAAGSPTSQQIACDTGAPTAPVEEIAAPGSSGLSYDSVTDQYTYVWKTAKGWKNTCRVLTVTLTDGTTHTATFKFS